MNEVQKNGVMSIVGICIVCVAYVSCYFICGETYHTSWHGDPMKFRLFNHTYQTKLWYPLGKLETALTPTEFYIHVRNGASLPYETE